MLSQQSSLVEKWERTVTESEGFYHCCFPLLEVQRDNWTKELKIEDKVHSV